MNISHQNFFLTVLLASYKFHRNNRYTRTFGSKKHLTETKPVTHNKRTSSNEHDMFILSMNDGKT